MITSKWAWIAGIGAGLLSVLCCIGPLVPILLGIGGASVLLGLDQYKPIFMGLGLLVLGGTSMYVILHHRRCCTTKNWFKEIQLISLVFGVGILSYAVLQYGIIPSISQIASEKIAETNINTFILSENINTAYLEIEGMTCAGCAVGVQKVLSEIPGIIAVDVNWETGIATIQYKTESISIENIKATKLPSPYILKEPKSVKEKGI